MNLQGLLTGLSLGAAYAIAAVGLTLVYRVSRVLNLAHGAVIMGVSLVLATQSVSNPVLLLALAIPLGMVGSGLVHVLTIRPFRDRDHVTRLAVLVGVLFAAGGLAQYQAGTDFYRLDPLVAGIWTLPGGATFSKHSFVTLLTVLVLVAVLAFFLNRTVTGKSLRALAEDPRGASLVGVPVERLLLMASLIAGGLAGIAAVLVVPQSGTSFNAGFTLTVTAVVAAVVGGMQSVWGAVLGGFLIGIGQGLMLQYYPEWFGTLQFGALILVLAFRPQGLIGQRT